MNGNIKNDIAFFFKKPEELDDQESSYSTLFLLRRDIRTCFGFNPDTNCVISYKALFPAVMAVSAGIDLLAKFACGVSEKVGPRYKCYIEQYIDKNYSEVLFQLRNSLLHSFGLYSESNSKGHKKKVFRFLLNETGDRLVEQIDDERFCINIRLLWEKFEASIEVFHRDILESDELQQKFSKMFPKYGSIQIY